ncbi:MAG: NTP transferase domain-containing protein [Magnetococcales bacterium]|nr:nucleotidyltransferase family protein [Magnetococcales bacterium]NGZ28396.1 NTP transferase domain-containing protein [Magnetococcales bacterium]
MKDWRTIVIPPDASILQAMEIMDRGSMRFGLVANSDLKLLGVVTDGDIRRGLLHRLGLEQSVVQVMNPTPQIAKLNDSREHILSLMRGFDLFHIPVVDDDNRIIRLETLQDLLRPDRKKNWVVLMAGGLGSRLGELTRDCPKPLLRIGGQPILEIILESFISFGFERFYISVNYKKQMIRDYFGNGSRWGVTIRYLEEEERLGTAGALSLIKEIPEEPLFVMNGDLLTRVDMTRILTFHQESQAKATLCVRKVEETLPFGVVESEHNRLLAIREKPTRSYFVNAGIYILEPEVLRLLPAHQPLDMPDLLQRVLDHQMPAATYPFLEYWLDIGRMGDFHQACQDVTEFSPS